MSSERDKPEDGSGRFLMWGSMHTESYSRHQFSRYIIEMLVGLSKEIGFGLDKRTTSC